MNYGNKKKLLLKYYFLIENKQTNVHEQKKLNKESFDILDNRYDMNYINESVL